ncbi:hypothetical protein Goarm_017289 [Gossypium armourianum]|uniref:Uncharacterized protein n=1 Tax=Gossypium armourianum TaxID=34283 RepID=A0A7J9JEW4_9ROSI|nr:hypothetical protein [Gossypium armourianum]
MPPRPPPFPSPRLLFTLPLLLPYPASILSLNTNRPNSYFKGMLK